MQPFQVDPAVIQLASSGNSFGLDLYQQQQAAQHNVVLSPYSISLALAMACAGSAGNTRSQMEAVLHIERLGHALHPSYSAFQDTLDTISNGAALEITGAQGLWLQHGFPVNPDLARLLEAHYRSAVHLVDFVRDPQAARGLINRWVEQRTKERIKELLPAGTVDALTRLVLANAIYFRGDWRHPFDPDRTATDIFWIGADTQVEVPFMVQQVETGYAESPEWQLLRLPYAGGEISMIIVLPRRRDGLASLERTLSPEGLARWITSIQRRRVNVRLPRFKIGAGFSLKAALMSLGMKDAFSPDNADFSRLADADEPLYIGAVAHKAFVEVNEKGTEAAAATGVVVAARAMPAPPAEFRADHPFLFLISHNRTGLILFLGRLSNPLTQG